MKVLKGSEWRMREPAPLQWRDVRRTGRTQRLCIPRELQIQIWNSKFKSDPTEIFGTILFSSEFSFAPVFKFVYGVTVFFSEFLIAVPQWRGAANVSLVKTTFDSGS